MRPRSILSLLSPLLLLPVGTPAAAQQGDGGERLSPLDSVSVAVGDEARIEIRYGRPSMRGRVVFGDLVPYGEIWRTGANEAAQLTTDTDLRLGDTALPAGHYSLYTIPDRRSWTLIVNRQTDQWGTQYDPERDVARIPMAVERLVRPVETFTISVVPAGDAFGEGAESEEEAGPGDGADANADAVLRLEWERTRASVPVRLAGRESVEEP